MVGRFLQRDDVVGAANDTQSLNRYAYCENDPVNVVDPSGRFGWSTIKGWGGSAVSEVRQVGGEVRSAASYVANEVRSKGFYGAAKSIWSTLTSAYSGSSAYTDARCASSSAGPSRSTSGYYSGEYGARAYATNISQMAATEMAGYYLTKASPGSAIGATMLTTAPSLLQVGIACFPIYAAYKPLGGPNADAYINSLIGQ